MIVLDTNVISELMRAKPARAVEAWFDTRSLLELATTTISVAEIRHGLARMPFGLRRRDLESRFNSLVARGFENRVFGFDLPAAEVYGDLAAGRERAGRRLAGFDGLIAAIAKSRSLPIATRNTGDFVECGVEVLNPWDDSASR